MDDYISRNEHEEYCRRMDDYNKRQDKRLDLLENKTQEIGSLAVSVERFAISVEDLAKEQKRQGEKLDVIEARDGNKWRQISSYIITIIVGAFLGFIFQAIGM